MDESRGGAGTRGTTDSDEGCALAHKIFLRSFTAQANAFGLVVSAPGSYSRTPSQLEKVMVQGLVLLGLEVKNRQKNSPSGMRFFLTKILR